MNCEHCGSSNVFFQARPAGAHVCNNCGRVASQQEQERVDRERQEVESFFQRFFEQEQA